LIPGNKLVLDARPERTLSFYPFKSFPTMPSQIDSNFTRPAFGSDAVSKSQAADVGRVAVAGREVSIEATSSATPGTAPEVRAFVEGADRLFEAHSVTPDAQPPGAQLPDRGALTGRLTVASSASPAGEGSVERTADLEALNFALLKPGSCDFVDSTKRSLFSGTQAQSARLDRPSAALQAVRESFRQTVETPSEKQIERLEQALTRWEQTQPGEFEARSRQVGALRTEMTGLAAHLQAERAKAAGVLGLSVSPSTADAFNAKVSYDGIGRVIGLKSDLSAEEIGRLKGEPTTPLTRRNAAGARETPRTETECLVAFVSELRRADTPQARDFAERAKALWMSGQVNAEQSAAFFETAVQALHDQPQLSGTANALLSDVRKEKSTTQYIDNLFGRHFDSEFARERVRNPSEGAKTTAAQLGQALTKQFDEWFGQLDFKDPADRERRLGTKMNDFAKVIGADIRPWFSKVPEVTAFLDKPTYAGFKAMMEKVDNGFDVIKVPFLAVKMATAEGMGLSTAQWKREGDAFYVKEVMPTRSTGSEITAGFESPYNYKVNLPVVRDRSHGTMLPHQAVNDPPEGFMVGRNVAASRILTPGRESQLEKNALANGHPVVCGTSGSTNILEHLSQHVATLTPEFSRDQAYLNTLAFLLFDGGHSVNESLIVNRALAVPEADQRRQVLQNYTASYEDLVELAPESERAAIRGALEQAFDETIALYRRLQSPSKPQRDVEPARSERVSGESPRANDQHRVAEASPGPVATAQPHNAERTRASQNASPVSAAPAPARAKWEVLQEELEKTYPQRVDDAYRGRLQQSEEYVQLNKLRHYIEKAETADAGSRDEILRELTEVNDGDHSRMSWLAHNVTNGSRAEVDELDKHLALHLEVLNRLSSEGPQARGEVLGALGKPFKQSLYASLDDRRLSTIPCTAKAYADLRSAAAPDRVAVTRTYADKLLEKAKTAPEHYREALQVLRPHLTPSQQKSVDKILTMEPRVGVRVSSIDVGDLAGSAGRLSDQIQNRLHGECEQSVWTQDAKRVYEVRYAKELARLKALQREAEEAQQKLYEAQHKAEGTFFSALIGELQRLSDSNARFDAERAAQSAARARDEAYHEWINADSGRPRFGPAQIMEKSAELGLRVFDIAVGETTREAEHWQNASFAGESWRTPQLAREYVDTMANNAAEKELKRATADYEKVLNAATKALTAAQAALPAAKQKEVEVAKRFGFSSPEALKDDAQRAARELHQRNDEVSAAIVRAPIAPRNSSLNLPRIPTAIAPRTIDDQLRDLPNTPSEAPSGRAASTTVQQRQRPAARRAEMDGSGR
jgi:RTX toxin RtxA